MPSFDFDCPEGHRIEIVRPYSKAGDPYFCPEHEEPCQRVWSAPTAHVSREYVNDILNGWVAGEGKPLSGHTMAETQNAAKAMAKQAPKQLAKVPNFTSFAGGPPRRNYTSD